ncbi:hypothetical protein [uncultured Faecalibaculum sp.]|uniref:hypothetical protein n=1 Tax=uncultured Faecalibaculum sp. TaxID=1729681 RepID=UPI00261806DA|nr:hypothetical protein [uncultured Faecalibaculum sp.]
MPKGKHRRSQAACGQLICSLHLSEAGFLCLALAAGRMNSSTPAAFASSYL